MPSDISRLTFRPSKKYNSVLLQQERTLLDADWNEQLDIQRQLAQTINTDLIGNTGIPKKNAGFQISPAEGDDNKYFQISKGRLYINGLLCELHTPSHYIDQPYYPNPDLQYFEDLSGSNLERLQVGKYIVYLDAWQQEINYLDDPAIQEVALGEADTTTRLQTVWQVKLFKIPADADLDSNDTDEKKWKDWIHAASPNGTLKARVKKIENLEKSCELTLHGGYQRQEHQLYRVEIHRGNTEEREQPTFKWSRDNATVETTIEEIDGAKLVVASLGKDEILGFAVGQWVEIVDSSSALASEAHDLLKIIAVNANKREIEIHQTPDIDLTGLTEIGKQNKLKSERFKLRRWDQYVSSDEKGQTISKDWIDLEDGVEINFSEGTYRARDYWLIPARSGSATIEWPENPIDHQPLEQKPRGVQHHYCKLAFVQVEAGMPPVIEDCLSLFPALSELSAIDVSYNNNQCEDTKAKNTQKMIDDLYQKRALVCTYLVEPSDGWEDVFEKIGAEQDAHICFQTGTYKIENPIKLKGKGHIKLTGCGLGTQILCSNSEMAFIFDNCESILIRDLHIESKISTSDEFLVSGSGNQLNGVVTCYQCKQVYVEDVQIKCAWGTGTNTNCLTIRTATHASIQNSNFLVGYLQQGVWLQNTSQILIKNNTFLAYDCSDEITLEELLKTEEFLRAYQEFLINNVSLDRGVAGSYTNIPYPQMSVAASNLRLSSADVESITIYYRTHQLLRRAWMIVLRENPYEGRPENDEQLANHVSSLTKSILTNPTFRENITDEDISNALDDSDSFDNFYAVLAKQVLKLGSLGIRIDGYDINDIKIENNTINGFMHGIKVFSRGTFFAGTVGYPNHQESMTIIDNTIHVLLPPVVHGLEKTGIRIDHYKKILIKNNHIYLERLPGLFNEAWDNISDGNNNPVSAIQVDGSLGKRMLITKNNIYALKEQNASRNITFTWGIDIFVSNSLASTPNTMWAITWNVLPNTRILIAHGGGTGPQGSFTSTSGTNQERIERNGVIVENNAQ